MLEAKGVRNLTDNQLKIFATRLSHLIKNGCRAYELVEYPKILFLTESEIDQRIEKLRSAANVDRISISLLKHASPNNSDSVVKCNVLRYLRPLGCYINRAEEIVKELKCSDAEMMEILIRNPRLLGVKYRKDIGEKVRYLIGHGARPQDLYRNTNVLNNKTLATIQSRAERLNRIGWKPLPIGILGREDSVFESVVGKHEAQHDLDTGQQVAGLDDVINLLNPSMSANRIATIRPKIKYLLTSGYMVSEIVRFPRVLSVSVEKLKMAVTELRPYYLESVDLAALHYYATHRRILLTSRRTHFRTEVARVIGCSRSELPPLPKDNSIRAIKDIQRTVLANVSYLRDQLGFSAEDLVSVPLVVGHSPDVLRRHWNALNCVDYGQGGRLARELFRRCADNRPLRLNLLQYCIEKEANFSHACVSTLTNDPDNEQDEFRVTETSLCDELQELSSGADACDDLHTDVVTCDTVDNIVHENDIDDDDCDPLIV